MTATRARRLGTPVLAGILLLALAGCDPESTRNEADGVPPTDPSAAASASGAADRAAAAPDPSRPSLEVVPVGGDLEVRAEGLPGGSVVEVLPCAAEYVRLDRGAADTMCSFNSDAGVAVETAADGSLRTTVEPEVFLKINGHEVLCDTGCVLGVVTGGRTVRAVAPFTLPDGVTVPEAPELTIESWTYDVRKNTGTAVVRGSGFEPGADVDLSQCPVAADGTGVDGPDCLYEYGTTAVADSRGAFRVDIAAYPLFQRSDGARADQYVDCAERPAVCAIGAPWVVGERVAVATLDTASRVRTPRP
ncbi:hypothetical protein [Myceligenerans salitolerans]|uniref:Neocarzinostatin family protein n=1 Tax=Myceligenerans salitolerans TaxID=1230528 RepID=A0ABS3I3T1_9MICO|nr:hypothetical protein [Myceligenerans salitolerans]MBO0607653.1 hypothetical protein [Myceligenerans salitolerans]